MVIPLTTQHYPMLQRNLLYTGVTRGRQLVVLVGAAEGAGDRGQGRSGAAALVEAAGVAGGGRRLTMLAATLAPPDPGGPYPG